MDNDFPESRQRWIHIPVMDSGTKQTEYANRACKASPMQSAGMQKPDSWRRISSL